VRLGVSGTAPSVELLEQVEVVPVDRPVLVAFAEQPLSLSAHTRYGPAAPLGATTDSTVHGSRLESRSACRARVRLRRAAMGAGLPSLVLARPALRGWVASRSPRRSPALAGRERLGFVRRVEVHVKVAVWSGLPADQGVDAPAALQPISAANDVERLQNHQDLGKGHVGRWHIAERVLVADGHHRTLPEGGRGALCWKTHGVPMQARRDT
jgi:hypothetical protein